MAEFSGAISCETGVLQTGAASAEAFRDTSRNHRTYFTAAEQTACRVLVVGPPAHLIGGMATVVAKHLELFKCEGIELGFFPLSIKVGRERGSGTSLRRHVRQIAEFLKRIKTLRPTIVHLHTCSGFSFFHSTLLAFIARRFGAKVVYHIHGAAFDRFFSSSGVVARWVIRTSLTRADCVIALSNHWQKEIACMAPGAKIEVIENAVELQPLVERRTEANPCRYLLLASMDDWKGIDDLLDACAIVIQKDAAIEVVLAGPAGSAGDASVLAEKIHDRGLTSRVRYVGPVQVDAKRQWLEWADVYVQPSRCEGMPMAVLEAMAAGLPVIATQVGAMPEVIEDGSTGRLVPPQHSELLADAMIELAKDGAKRRHWGIAAHELVKRRFSTERFRADLLGLYQSLTSDHLLSR